MKACPYFVLNAIKLHIVGCYIYLGRYNNIISKVTYILCMFVFITHVRRCMFVWTILNVDLLICFILRGMLYSGMLYLTVRDSKQ